MNEKKVMENEQTNAHTIRSSSMLGAKVFSRVSKKNFLALVQVYDIHFRHFTTAIYCLAV